MPASLIVDSGVWFAMFDPRDQHFNDCDDKAELVETLQVVIPWPTMHETLRTRFVRNSLALRGFERLLSGPRNIEFLSDSDYREQALSLTFESSLHKDRPISLVDWIIRLMILDDRNVRISHLATFNKNDFRDVCERRGVGLV